MSRKNRGDRKERSRSRAAAVRSSRAPGAKRRTDPPGARPPDAETAPATRAGGTVRVPAAPPPVTESAVRPAAPPPPAPAPVARTAPPPPPSPAKPAAPPAPVARPAPPASAADRESGTLAGFVSATRRLFKKFTGAPPEVRIALPNSELRLFKLHGPLDERLALQAATWLLFVQAMKAEADLVLTIDSVSGTLPAALSLADVMSKTTCLVRTHCAGKAIGGSALILACGRRGCRTMSPGASLTLPAASRNGDLHSRRFLDALAQATGRPAASVDRDLVRPSPLGPKAAVRLGFADAVGL